MNWEIIETILALLGIASWLFLIIVYSFKFKKVILAALFLITAPLFASSLVDFMAFVWPSVWWLMTIIKSLRKKVPKEASSDFEYGFNYINYLLMVAGLYISILTSITVPQFLSALYFGGPDIPGNYNTILGRISDVFEIATFLLFAYLLARRSRTFVEDIAKIAVVGKDGANLTFPRSLSRYILMFATFPLGFGLVNFIFKEPVYNKWTGAVEYRNANQAIKDGWFYRMITGADRRAESAERDED